MARFHCLTTLPVVSLPQQLFENVRGKNLVWASIPNADSIRAWYSLDSGTLQSEALIMSSISFKLSVFSTARKWTVNFEVIGWTLREGQRTRFIFPRALLDHGVNRTRPIVMLALGVHCGKSCARFV